MGHPMGPTAPYMPSGFGPVPGMHGPHQGVDGRSSNGSAGDAPHAGIPHFHPSQLHQSQYYALQQIQQDHPRSQQAPAPQAADGAPKANGVNKATSQPPVADSGTGEPAKVSAGSSSTGENSRPANTGGGITAGAPDLTQKAVAPVSNSSEPRREFANAVAGAPAAMFVPPPTPTKTTASAEGADPNVDSVKRDFFLCRPARGKGTIPTPDDDVFVGYPPAERLMDVVQSRLEERVTFSKRLGNLDERVAIHKADLLAKLRGQFRPAQAQSGAEMQLFETELELSQLKAQLQAAEQSRTFAVVFTLRPQVDALREKRDKLEAQVWETTPVRGVQRSHICAPPTASRPSRRPRKNNPARDNASASSTTTATSVAAATFGGERLAQLPECWVSHGGSGTGAQLFHEANFVPELNKVQWPSPPQPPHLRLCESTATGWDFVHGPRRLPTARAKPHKRPASQVYRAFRPRNPRGKWIQCANMYCRKWRRLPVLESDASKAGSLLLKSGSGGSNSGAGGGSGSNTKNSRSSLSGSSDRTNSGSSDQKLSERRRAAFSIPKVFTCVMNNWDPRFASCSVPQEYSRNDLSFR